LVWQVKLPNQLYPDNNLAITIEAN